MTFVQPGGRIAVSGATGFVGQALVEHLSDCGYEVVGLSERADPPLRIKDTLHDYHCVDLTQAWPDLGPVAGVVHLAGLAAVGPSFESPQTYIDSNSAMVTQLFERAVEDCWQGRAIIVSSGAVYGGDRGAVTFTEEFSTVATSPYVVSKLLVESQTEYYRRRGIDAIIARPFNHIGPGQRPGFIVPDLTEKVLGWRPGTALPVGNLNSERDYTDVRDIANAYRVLLEKAALRFATYNVCSGVTRTGWEVLDLICASLGLSVPPTVSEDRRSVDPSVVKGSAERLRKETGWRPTISVETSINDFTSEYVAGPASQPKRRRGNVGLEAQ